MAKGDEKARRMELRRQSGNRTVDPSRYEPPPKGPRYLIAHACFACRASLKRPPSDEPLVCPTCGGPAYEVGRAFKTPASDDLEQWKKVQALYAHGFRFGRYGPYDNVPALPERYREVEQFVRDNPNHPYRVGEPDESLLP
jgi:hypothetical protein